MSVRGLAARHVGQIAVFEAAPKLFYASEYFEALKGSMRDARVYFMTDSVHDPRVDLDLSDTLVGADVFRKGDEGQ